MQLRSGLTVFPAPQHPAAPQAPPIQIGNQPQADPAGIPDAHQRHAAFVEGVRLCLSQWTALQLAVENQWGGGASSRKAAELGETIVAWFAARAHKRAADGTPQFYADELEDVLDETVLQSFNTDVEDGSLEEVSTRLMQVHEECWVGDFSTVSLLQQSERERQQQGSRRAVAASRRLQNEGDDDESDDSMEEDDGDIGTSQGTGHPQQQQPHRSTLSVCQAGEHTNGVPGGGANFASMERGPGRPDEDSSMSTPQLSQQEVDDGWQQVPPRRSGRRR